MEERTTERITKGGRSGDEEVPATFGGEAGPRRADDPAAPGTAAERRADAEAEREPEERKGG